MCGGAMLQVVTNAPNVSPNMLTVLAVSLAYMLTAYDYTCDYHARFAF
jgi:hypothetical protein